MKLSAWFRRRNKREKDLDEEIRAHLAMAIRERIEQGENPAEAEANARRAFGNATLVKEVTRDIWGWGWLETLLQDVRYGLRQLRRNPGFTAVSIITLALGIGATTAIFSVVDAVLLHGTPYQNAAQLVEIGTRSPHGEEESVSVGDFNDWREQGRTFQGLAAYKEWEFHALTGVGEPDEVWTSPVSTNLFHLLGVHAIVGRTFAESETQAVVLSREYWRTHFAASPKIIGKTLALDGKPYTVIGIAPADLEFPAPNTQAWIPLIFNAGEKSDHEHRSLSVIARLKAGVTLSQAQAQMDVAARRLGEEYSKTNAGWIAPVKPFKGRQIRGFLRTAIFTLLGAAAFVLMIVCVNVASMLLARGTARQGEMSIRAALGAGRWRLIRQLVVESTMLAGTASVAGLVLARSGLDLIESLVPKYSLVETQSLHRIAINLPVLGFAVALSLLTGIAVGLLPALRISSPNLNESLKESGHRSGSSTRESRLQRGLVICEVALALVLLVGAGLMIKSFDRLEAAPTGFNPGNLLTVRVPLVRYKYSEGPKSAAFYREVLERIRAIPGVRFVGMANNLPFTGFHISLDFPGPPNSPNTSERTIYVTARSVSPGYFRAMGIPLKAGRDFTQADNQKSASCVRIVNEALARRYWPGENPVGRQISGACPKDAPALIVGVVGDSKQDAVDSRVKPELYEPYGQHPWASFLVTFVIRSASDPLDLAAAVRRAVWEIDHDQPVIQVRTMEDVITESLWRQHFSASMLGIFALIALVLSAIGIYAVLSYSISRRTHEIGIRAALGATHGNILRMVVGESLLLILIGVGAGILAALSLTRLLRSLLYGVGARDPLTFVALSMLLTGVAVLASYIPARRATKVDPMVALRHE